MPLARQPPGISVWDDQVFDDPFDGPGEHGVLLRGRTGMHRYVVCYDIVADRRRVRVAHCMESYGARMQKSVFEVVVSRRTLARLVADLTRLIDASEDRVSLYPLCAGCDARRVDLGTALPKPVHEAWVII